MIEMKKGEYQKIFWKWSERYPGWSWEWASPEEADGYSWEPLWVSDPDECSGQIWESTSSRIL